MGEIFTGVFGDSFVCFDSEWAGIERKSKRKNWKELKNIKQVLLLFLLWFLKKLKEFVCIKQ